MRFFKVDLLEPQRVQYLVYDPNEEKVIAIFENGKFKTENDLLADRLLQLGYKEIKEETGKPEEKPKEEPKKFVCDVCGHSSDTGAGLSAHKRFNHKD